MKQSELWERVRPHLPAFLLNEFDGSMLAWKNEIAAREKRMREVAEEIAEDLARDTASEITVRVHRARLEAHRAKLLEELGAE